MYTIEINDEEVTAALTRAVRAMGNLREFMQDAGELLQSSTQDRIERGEQPDGQPFAPRSQTTLDRYARIGKPFGAPLNYSGAMRLGIHFEAGEDYLELGSNALQAAVMQFGAKQDQFGQTARGGPIPWGDIPARPFLGLSEQDKTDLLAELGDWLEQALRD